MNQKMEIKYFWKQRIRLCRWLRHPSLTGDLQTTRCSTDLELMCCQLHLKRLKVHFNCSFTACTYASGIWGKYFCPFSNLKRKLFKEKFAEQKDLLAPTEQPASHGGSRPSSWPTCCWCEATSSSRYSTKPIASPYPCCSTVQTVDLAHVLVWVFACSVLYAPRSLADPGEVIRWLSRTSM